MNTRYYYRIIEFDNWILDVSGTKDEDDLCRILFEFSLQDEKSKVQEVIHEFRSIVPNDSDAIIETMFWTVLPMIASVNPTERKDVIETFGYRWNYPKCVHCGTDRDVFVYTMDDGQRVPYCENCRSNGVVISCSECECYFSGMPEEKWKHLAKRANGEDALVCARCIEEEVWTCVSCRTSKLNECYSPASGVCFSCEEIARITTASKQAQRSGRPWMITLDVDLDTFTLSAGKISTFCFSIREQESHKLIADLPNIPREIPLECATVLEDAIRICREAGPTGSDWRHVWYWDDVNKRKISVKVQPVDEHGNAFLESDYLLDRLTHNREIDD